MSDALFWKLAGELQATDAAVVEGTIMGSRCLRAGSEFLAIPEHRTGALVVKLPAPRVRELIEGGRGTPFAPAGRVFNEWVRVVVPDEPLWRRLLEEGRTFVATSSS